MSDSLGWRRLKNRVAALEAENTRLRPALTDLAAIAKEVVVNDGGDSCACQDKDGNDLSEECCVTGCVDTQTETPHDPCFIHALDAAVQAADKALKGES